MKDEKYLSSFILHPSSFEKIMLVLFCLRLALGLLACLLLLSPAQINPRFYRTHFLVVLALAAVAAGFGRQAASTGLLIALGCAIVLALVGFFCWSLEGAPLRRSCIIATTATLAGALVLLEMQSGEGLGWRLAADATSAALLGSATTAMLMGHMYLIAPGMTMTPLMRLLAVLLGAIGARLALAAVGLWLWSSTASHSLFTLKEEANLWLPVRWGLGLVAPLVLGVMARQTAKIRSTQSATGILYVVVIFCFLGELTGQLLQNTTGYTL
jgi:hypothetical protein